MRSPTLLPFVAALVAAASLLSAAPLASTIRSVTVYTDRAVVTRQASLDIAAPGVIDAEFTGLPAALVEQSIQASGKGTARASILDLSTRSVHLESTHNTRVLQLEEELKGLRAQMQLLEDKGKLLAQQAAFLDKILTGTAQPPAQGQTRPTLEDWTKLLGFQQEQLARNAELERRLKVEAEALQAKIDAAQQNLDQLRGDAGKEVKVVVVRIDASSAGKLELSLSYAVPGAQWSPGYDARLRLEARQLELSYFGQVVNRTGEDWSEVALTLSTAKPSLGGGAPELRPWIVDVLKPVVYKSSSFDSRIAPPSLAAARVKGASYGAKLEAQALAAPPALEESVTLDAFAVTAAVDSSGASATFRIAAPFTLRADGSTQKVSVASLRLPAKLQFDAVPKLSEIAYLGASVANGSDYPLLAGPVSIFLDENFVATSRLKTVMPGEKFDLALGADEGISIKRRLVNRFTENVGLTNKTVRVTYDVLITITNNKRATERVVFKEPVPVSRHEQVEVSLVTPSEKERGTKEAPREVTLEDDGRLVWRVDLKAGEKREFPVKITVQHPVGTAVTGLE